MAGDEVTVRPARMEDAQNVRDNCFSMNTLEEVRSRLEDSLGMYERGDGVQLVAEVDGVVVGTVVLARNLHPLYAHRAELTSLVVHSKYQRRGIARRLVEASGSHALSIDIEILEIGCRGGTAAEHVYRRLGFTEYGRLPRGILEPWGEGRAYDQVFFYRKLERALEE